MKALPLTIYGNPEIIVVTPGSKFYERDTHRELFLVLPGGGHSRLNINESLQVIFELFTCHEAIIVTPKNNNNKKIVIYLTPATKIKAIARTTGTTVSIKGEYGGGNEEIDVEESITVIQEQLTYCDEDWSLDTSGGVGSSSDCPCETLEVSIETSADYDLDITDETIEKYYLVFSGSTDWVLNLPDTSTAAYRGIEIYAVFLNDGTIVVNPSPSDSLGSNGVGNSTTGNVSAGDSGLIWIASSGIWGGFGSGGGGGTVDNVYQFTSTAAQLTYTPAQLIAALLAGTFPGTMTGRILTLVHGGGAEWAQQGSVVINGGGGLTFTSDPGTQVFNVQFI